MSTTDEEFSFAHDDEDSTEDITAMLFKLQEFARAATEDDEINPDIVISAMLEYAFRQLIANYGGVTAVAIISSVLSNWAAHLPEIELGIAAESSEGSTHLN